MALVFASLNSGSNGNCYYVGNHEEAILVDAGISCREVEKRMTRLGLRMSTIKAIFISHEHTDHIRGLSLLARKHALPVYATENTHQQIAHLVDVAAVQYLSYAEPVFIGGLAIKAFSKLHDAADPCSFTISYMGATVGVFTDLGFPCKQLTKHFSLCHAAFLESNYDDAMLENGGYPYHLKRRIRGGKGHLSNTQALDVFLQHRPSHMSHLVLSHLSHNNNCPKLVGELFTAHAGNVQVVVASRFQETELFEVHSQALPTRTIKSAAPAQLALAF